MLKKKNANKEKDHRNDSYHPKVITDSLIKAVTKSR